MRGKSGARNNVSSSHRVSLKNLRPKAIFNLFFRCNFFLLSKSHCKPLWSWGLGIDLAFNTCFLSCFHLSGPFPSRVQHFCCFWGNDMTKLCPYLMNIQKLHNVPAAAAFSTLNTPNECNCCTHTTLEINLHRLIYICVNSGALET